MCGIAGIFAYAENSSPVDADEMERISASMSTRGPDGSGQWTAEKRHIGLAHRRLAIIDLSETGYQPMTGKQGGLRIVFNGEIYNHRALRLELEKKGYVFTSTSDTEVLLHLYTDRGFKMVQDLRGMYAFALWDESRQGLFLARDPFGVKPLYYHNDGNTFRCASQVKALVAGRGFNLQPEPAGHVGFFLWGSVPEPFTMYKDIFALPAGHFLWVDAQGVRTPRKFFSVSDEYEFASTKHVDLKDGVDVLRTVLQESVHYHLIADVPVGVFLSAGLDSSVITALSAEESPLIQAVTLGFDEFEKSRMDETLLAGEVASYYGCRHEIYKFALSDFSSEYENILKAMDQPSVDGINTYFVALAAKRSGLKVALSGLGGDELLGGYPSFSNVPRLVSLGKLFGFLPGIGRAFRWFSAPFIKHMTSPKYAGLLEYGGSYGGAYLLRRGLFMPWELPQFLDAQLVRDGWATLQPVLRLNSMLSDVKDNFARVSALELSTYMRNTLLRDSDWAGMAHSLEIRVPMVDVEVFRTLAPYLSQKTVALSKRDLAAVPAKPLPAGILNRPKTGFAVPTQQWLGKIEGAPRLRGLRGWALQVYSSLNFPREKIKKHTNPRALALVSDAYGSSGGIAKYNRDLLNAMSSGRGGAYMTAIPRSSNKLSDYDNKPPQLFHDTRGVGGKFRYGWNILNTIWSQSKLDFVLAGHINLLPLAYLVAKSRGIPLWCIIYGIDAWKPNKNWFVNGLVAKVNGYISISHTTKSRFINWSKVDPENVIVHPNCYDPIELGLGEKNGRLMERYGIQDRSVIMTMGRLATTERYKGIDEVLEILPDVVREMPEITYLIVGDGNDKGRLQNKSETLGLSKNVVFTGYVPENEKTEHFRLADGYIMPSKGEGFGFVLIEAMACGVPVVGSKLDGGREALRDGLLGNLVDPEKPDEIKDAILQVLLKKNKSIPYGLEYFDLRSFTKRTALLVKRILSGQIS